VWCWFLPGAYADQTWLKSLLAKTEKLIDKLLAPSARRWHNTPSEGDK